MGKGIKNIAKKATKIAVGTISTLLVLLITLPLLASLLINLPGIQNAVVRRVMSSLSENLGTTVSIDRIHVKLINRVVVDGFYVEDFAGDTLLYVPKLTAPIIEPGLVGEPLTFGRVKLEKAEMWLRRDTTGTVNIKHIVNAIRGDRPKNPDANFRLKIMGIEADSLTFGLLRWDKPFRDEGVDFSRFVIRDTKVDIDDFAIIKDTIRIGIRSLSFDERSGFHINDLSAHDLVIANGLVSLDNARIKSAGADLDLPSIRLKGTDWLAFREFLDSVAVDVAIRRSHLTTGFLGWFLPAVAEWGVTLDDLALQTKGPVAAMSGSITQARTLDTSFALDFTSRGMPDFANMRLDADIRSLATSGGDIDSLMRSVTGKGLPESVAVPVKRLGQCGFSGRFNGSFNDFAANGTLVSEAGEVYADASVVMRDDGSAVDGRVAVPRLELGRLLAVKDLGALSGDFALNGKLEKGGHIEGAINGDIGALAFRKYAYRGIALDGRLDDKMFDGTIRAHDPSLDFDFSGLLDFNDSIPRYNFALDLRNADFAATHLNRTDSVSLLSGRLTASATGNNLDNLNGTIEVHDPVYISSADTVRTDVVTITGRNSAASKYIGLASEFADAEFRSRVSYRDMFAYLGDFLREYIPMLYDDGSGKTLPVHERSVAAAANYSVLNLKVKDTDKLFAALMPGTHVAEDTGVSFTFNPFVRDFTLSAKSEFVEFNNMLATNIELNSDNKTDSLTLHLTSGDFYSGSLHIPNLALHGGSKGRKATLSTRLTDATDNFSAMLGLNIDTERDNGNRSLRFRFNTSYITLDEKTWFIRASSVVYDTTRVAVNNFRVYSEGNAAEELTVNGIISRSPSDTLRIRLNDFDLSPLRQLVKGVGYGVGGRATGYVDFMSLRKETRMNAGIDFRGLSLNGEEAAPLRFTSFWDRGSERVRFQMLNQNNNVNVLSGSFAPSNGGLDAVAAIDSLDVGLLDPLLVNVLENTKGKANFHLKFGGTFKKLRMDGRIDIPRFETTVKYTQARYVLENAVMTVDNSRLRLPQTIVRDPFGNTADFGMTIDMSNLKNIGVDINAVVHNLLAVDTGPDNNEAFYGRVFATGSLGIKVDKMGTKMGISATTGRGTKFHLPLNAKSNISWADFVVLADPARGADTTDVLTRKKLIYERQLQQGQQRAKRRKPLDMDITVDLTPDAEFHMLIDPNLGNGISAHGRGVLNMRINPATNLFSMVGDCTIVDGRFDFSMMDVFNKDFTITPGGTLVWTGEPEDALLNLEASYRVRTSLSPLIGENSSFFAAGGSSVPVDCVIRLTERLSQPDVSFDVRLSSADADAQLIVNNAMNTQELKSTQFLSLLITGSFVTNNSLAGQTVNSGALATGAVGFDILTSQLGNLLSSEDYNIYFKYRPQNEYIGSQFDVGFSTAFIDNRLLLEIEGNYVDDRAATSVGSSNVSNLAGDVALTWVIDRAGNWRLKVFSQTIDRFNETQGRQESGLGIYYKKDFDSFRDVWRKNRDTFVNFGSDSVVTKKTKRKKSKQ